MDTIEQTISNIGIVPVIVLKNSEHAIPLADALVAGNLPIMEITLRSEAGLDSISKVAGRSDVLVGAGTVLNVAAAKDAITAGAKFIVSPGLDPETVEFCQSNDVPVFPGVCTPSEVQRAYNLGVKTVKFFPAEAYGGIKTLSALAGPFPMLKFLPTGGISIDSLPDYITSPSVVAVGGSWMVKGNLIESADFAAITQLASQAVAYVQRLRTAQA